MEGNATASALRGFSLIEILVAVTLISVIMLALVAMLNQTQRAFRGSIAQADIMETGRSVADLLRTEMLEIKASSQTNFPDFVVMQSMDDPVLIQELPSGGTRTNGFDDFYFMKQRNDNWIGTLYAISNAAAGAGTLYRLELSATNRSLARQVAEDLFYVMTDRRPDRFVLHDFRRVADGVVHLRLEPRDREGFVVVEPPPATWGTLSVDYAFTNSAPAFVEFELGVLEPKEWERIKDRSPAQALDLLTNKADRVHLFRQSIPIRSTQ